MIDTLVGLLGIYYEMYLYFVVLYCWHTTINFPYDVFPYYDCNNFESKYNLLSIHVQ
jgi:hypothetical protein